MKSTPKVGSLVVIGFDDGIRTGVVTESDKKNGWVFYLDLESFQINECNGAPLKVVASPNDVRIQLARIAAKAVVAE